MQKDFSQGQYYITGQLTQSIFAEDCEFIDPTTNVRNPAVYSRAVATLFDQTSSRADLIDIKVRPSCRTHAAADMQGSVNCMLHKLSSLCRSKRADISSSETGSGCDRSQTHTPS